LPSLSVVNVKGWFSALYLAINAVSSGVSTTRHDKVNDIPLCPPNKPVFALWFLLMMSFIPSFDLLFVSLPADGAPTTGASLGLAVVNLNLGAAVRALDPV
jgi:hypothetical protein